MSNLINFFISLDTQAQIELIGIIVSLALGLAALFISYKTLRQNSDMIESSSRPYIGIYGISTYLGFRQYYIILKNYGQSAAQIKSLTYDYDLSLISKHDNFDPFSHIDGTTIMPGQSYRSAVDFDKITADKITAINFHLEYSSGTKKYSDDICLKIDANLGNLEAHAPEMKNPPEDIMVMQTISNTLQDMHIKSL